MVRAAAATLGFAIPSMPAEERTLGPSPSGDAALALAASRGDRQAFGRLVDWHKRSVYGLCQRLLRHPEDARDAAQETFVRAYAALGTYDPALPFAPWLLRIARNHCLDLARRRGVRPPEVALDADPEAGGRRELPDRSTPLPDESLAARQQVRRLEAAVAALPQHHREVVQLFHVEHLSYKEIARTMDVPIGTVMTWLHRARARLRQDLGTGEERP
jgi:RNA polymerase sigma-70 factor (ECF subfamily)